jgi:hypothetical protein
MVQTLLDQILTLSMANQEIFAHALKVCGHTHTNTQNEENY